MTDNKLNKTELGLIQALLAQEMCLVRDCYRGTEPFEETACYRHIREVISKVESQIRDIEEAEAWEAKQAELPLRIRG